MIDSMRRSFIERAAEGAPPEAWERAAVHVLYLGSGLFAFRLVAGLAGVGRHFRLDAAGQLLVVAAACLLFTFWGAFRRTPPFEGWFASHLVWLTTTWAMLGGIFAACLLGAGVLTLLALLVPPVLFLMFAVLLAAWLATAWLAWRVLRGYPAFLRRDPIGLIDPDRAGFAAGPPPG